MPLGFQSYKLRYWYPNGQWTRTYTHQIQRSSSCVLFYLKENTMGNGKSHTALPFLWEDIGRFSLIPWSFITLHNHIKHQLWSFHLISYLSTNLPTRKMAKTGALSYRTTSTIPTHPSYHSNDGVARWHGRTPHAMHGRKPCPMQKREVLRSVKTAEKSHGRNCSNCNIPTRMSRESSAQNWEKDIS